MGRTVSATTSLNFPTMPAAPLPPSEAQRLRALHSYGILDTPPEKAFDELVTLAARICGTPISLVTFVDRDRQWFKAHHGLDLIETPRALSFCAHGLSRPDQLLIVADATCDPRFADNPFVTGEPGVRFYAGVPLCTNEGQAVGTLCVIDRQPRILSPEQQEALGILGRQVMTHLELRRSLNEIVLNHTRLENSQRIAGLGDWEHDFSNNRLSWSDGVYRILDILRKDFEPDSEIFYRHVHPDDLSFVHAEKKTAATGLRRVNFEHRIVQSDGKVRYIHQIAEMIFDDKGNPVRESGTIQDITDRKLAVNALRQSEERYRTLLMLSPDATFVLVDGLVVLANHAFCRLMGAGEQAQLLGRPATEMVHPDCRALLLNSQNPADHAAMPLAEMKFIRRDGTSVDVEVTSMLFDFQGRQQMQFIARDVTVRKQGEEQLREKTAFLEANVDASLDGILIVDLQGKIIIRNQLFRELLKIPESLREISCDEKMFHFLADLVVNRDAFTTKMLHLYAHPDETNHDELELKDGKILDRYSSPVYGKDGKSYGRIWTFRDITARKTAERTTRESEQRFKLVARAVSDVIWDWDLSTHTLWWNDGFLTTFGFIAGEISPSLESWTGRIHPDERVKVVDSIHHAIDSGAENWGAEYQFQRKDGSYALVQDRGYILRDPDGKGTRMVGGMRDLTEQRKMEMQYLRAQRLDSIGTLASGIAHDLNNVLSPIMMGIELLKEDQADDPPRSKIIEAIVISCRRGSDLVRQVLSFARGMDGERIPLRLRHLITDLDGIISETFPRNIRIVTRVAANLWAVVGDASQLHQILLNLSVNARDAMPKGGTLTVEASNVTIDTQFAGTSHGTQAGQYVLVQVTDTGCGIPVEIRERIFEPFFTTKDIGHGTGLGLATVHTVVKSHGGFMNIESEVGRGTVFKIYLPADPNAETSTTVPPFVADPPRGRNELVLIVDDEPSIRDITRVTLETFGYRVLTANDGADAIAVYAQHVQEISVVLTDMMMPVMDGLATIQVLRRINPSVRIIASSGLSATENADQAIKAGAYDFLYKPFTAQTLLTLIRETLDRPVAPFMH